MHVVVWNMNQRERNWPSLKGGELERRRTHLCEAPTNARNERDWPMAGATKQVAGASSGQLETARQIDRPDPWRVISSMSICGRGFVVAGVT